MKSKFSSKNYFKERDANNELKKLEIIAGLRGPVTHAFGRIKEDLNIITHKHTLPKGWQIRKNTFGSKALMCEVTYSPTPPTYLNKVEFAVMLIGERATIIFFDHYQVMKRVLLDTGIVSKRFGLLYWQGHRVRVFKDK